MANETESELLRLARQLGLNPSELDEVHHTAHFSNREFERLVTALVRNVGGDQENMAHWLRTWNTQLGGTPLDLVKTREGFESVLGYLERFINR